MKVSGKKKGNPLRQPRVVSKWYRIDEFGITVERCRACGEAVSIGREQLEAERFIQCSCGKGCFEVELRVVHTIEAD